MSYLKPRILVDGDGSIREQNNDGKAAAMSKNLQELERKRRAMAAQKKSSSDYIGNLPTNLGGKVKDLDPVLKEQIIKKYMEANNGEQE